MQGNTDIPVVSRPGGLEQGRCHGRRVRANGDEHRMPGKGGSGFCGEQEAVAGAGGGWPQDLSQGTGAGMG